MEPNSLAVYQEKVKDYDARIFRLQKEVLLIDGRQGSTAGDRELKWAEIRKLHDLRILYRGFVADVEKVNGPGAAAVTELLTKYNTKAGDFDRLMTLMENDPQERGHAGGTDLQRHLHRVGLERVRELKLLCIQFVADIIRLREEKKPAKPQKNNALGEPSQLPMRKIPVPPRAEEPTLDEGYLLAAFNEILKILLIPYPDGGYVTRFLPVRKGGYHNGVLLKNDIYYFKDKKSAIDAYVFYSTSLRGAP